MSVLDIVDWHAFDVEKNEKPPDETGKLIRGSYFYAFVQEAAQKIGPQFYNFISDRVDDIDTFFMNPVFGTLMPFSRGMEAKFEREGSEKIIPEVNGHPSVKSWIIQPDGQVRIQRVGILASIDVEGRVHFDCDNTIQFNVIPHMPGYVDLNTLLAQVSTVNNDPNRFRPSYVVSLYLHEPSGIPDRICGSCHQRQ